MSMIKKPGRGQGTEDGGQLSVAAGQRTEVRGQKAENRRIWNIQWRMMKWTGCISTSPLLVDILFLIY